MAFVPAPNIVMVEIRATLGGQKIENRVMVDALTTPTASIVSDICNVVNVWAQGTYFDQLPDAVALTEVVATDLTVENGDQITITPVGPFVGALLGTTMPNEVSFCVSLRSSSRGRSARGRAYVLGLVQSDVNGNNLSSTRAEGLRSAFEELKTVINEAGWALTIVSYRHNNAPRVGGPVYFLVETVVVTDLVVDSMRRRKPGVGS